MRLRSRQNLPSSIEPEPVLLEEDGDEELDEDEDDAPQRRPPINATLDLGAVDSPRMRRMSQYFSSQLDLLEQMRTQVEQETAPLVELLIRQRKTMQQMASNLEERLGPLEAYAETEEANLASLQERLSTDGGDFLARSFADYVTLQRGRIEETRGRIEQQRQPLRRFGDEQRSAVEVALSRFDEEMSSLEEILAEQRRVMMRMLDAMRSETFVAVKDYLADRHDALADIAQRRITDPAAIGDSLRSRRSLIEATSKSAGGEQVSQVLRATDSADQQFASSTPATAPRAMRPTAPPPPLLVDEEEDDDEPSTPSMPPASDLLAERA